MRSQIGGFARRWCDTRIVAQISPQLGRPLLSLRNPLPHRMGGFPPEPFMNPDPTIEGSLAQTPGSMPAAVQGNHYLDAVRAEGGGNRI
jgi:hypothetical protein